MAEVIVIVDVFSISTMRIRMTVLDTIGDAKMLINEATGIPVERIELKYSDNRIIRDADNDMEIGKVAYWGFETKYAKLMMVRCSDEDFQTVHELKTMQVELPENNVKVCNFRKATLHIMDDFFALASHHLPPSETASASSGYKPAEEKTVRGDTKTDLKRMKQKMADLQAENADLSYRMKQNTAEIRNLLKKCRDMNIDIEMLRPSGETFTVQGRPADTVSKFKRHLEAEYGFRYLHQRLIRNTEDGTPMELQNNRKLFSYGVENSGDQISIVMTGGTAIATPKVPDAVVETSDEEEILSTPPMSDDDVPEPPQPSPERMQHVVIKDYVSKDVMFHGNLDRHMSLAGVLDFITEFESIPEDEKSDLCFCDSRGDSSALFPALTLGAVLDSAYYNGIYVKVKGLSGGALVRGHLTKQQMLDRFKKKSRDFIKQLKSVDDEDEELSYNPAVVPQSIHDFMEDKHEKLQAIELLMKEKLKGKKDVSELRILKSINLMFPTMAVIEQTKLGLTLLQKELATSLLMLYATRYNEEYGGELRYSHTGFLKDLGEEMIKRQVRPMAEPERGCVLS
eukprot:Skav225757  [mRNA]  locus=scaffold3552:10008:11791:- [translate_table: standard]